MCCRQGFRARAAGAWSADVARRNARVGCPAALDTAALVGAGCQITITIRFLAVGGNRIVKTREEVPHTSPDRPTRQVGVVGLLLEGPHPSRTDVEVADSFALLECREPLPVVESHRVHGLGSPRLLE